MQEAEMTEEQANKVIKFKNDIEKLMKNPTFKKLITEGYFKDEPARLAQALTNPEMQDEVDQRMLQEMLRGCGHLNNYIQYALNQGRKVEAELKAHYDEIEAAKLAEETPMIVDNITGDEIPVEEA